MNTPDLHVWGYASGCPACDSLKALLDAHGVIYDFHVVTPTSEGRASLRAAGYATVPQAFFPDGEWAGDYTYIRKALNV